MSTFLYALAHVIARLRSRDRGSGCSTACCRCPSSVNGAGQLILGGSSGGLLQACVILALWTAGGLLASTLAIARKRPRLSTTPAAVPFEPVQPAPVPSTA